MLSKKANIGIAVGVSLAVVIVVVVLVVVLTKKKATPPPTTPPTPTTPLAGQWQVLLDDGSVFNASDSVDESILNLVQAADTDGMLTLESEYNNTTQPAVPYLRAVFELRTDNDYNVTFYVRGRTWSGTRTATLIVAGPNDMPANMEFDATHSLYEAWRITMNKIT